jgi:hypothetical protein
VEKIKNILYRWITAYMTKTGMMLCFGGGPSPASSQPTQTTVTNTNLPEYARPYVENVLGKGQALTDTSQNPYQSYQGERIAGFTPMQQQAFSNIGDMNVAGQVGAGTGLAAGAGLGGMYAGQNYANQATDPNAVAAYMSPYMQNVVDYQKEQAIKDYGRQLPGIGASAARSGAFGGSRHAIVESEAQRNLQNQLAGIQAQGTQSAYDKALQNQQFGANLGLQGYGLANTAAGTLGQLGQTQYGQQMGINAAQQQAGAQQQALQQQALTNQYQDFLNRQNYPYKQLGFMSDLIHGTSLSGGTASSLYQAPPPMTSILAGLGQTALGGYMYGLGGGGGRAEGGEIKGYAEGGLVSIAENNSGYGEGLGSLFPSLIGEDHGA